MANGEAAVVAAETLGHDMLEGILQSVREFPGWDSLAKHQQDVHIDRLDKRIRMLVGQALDIVFRGDYPACVAELDAVAFGKSIRAKITIAKTSASRHELADAAGQTVIIVMANSEQYFERMKEIRGAADQKDLFHDSSQPLGHMGTDAPPEPDAALDTGLDDVLPETAAEPPVDVPKELSYGQVRELLLECGIDPDELHEPFEWWTQDRRVEAYVWGLAHRKWAAAGGDGPEGPTVPVWLRPAILTADVHVIAVTRDGPEENGEPAAADTTKVLAGPEGQPVAGSPDSDEWIVKALEMRGIKLPAKRVKKWSSTQRVAARAWLQGLTTGRPEFIPAPADEAPTA